MWKVGLAIVAVVALAGTAVGLVAAQEDAGVLGGGRLNNLLERLAGNLGISQDELETAIDQTQLQVIDEALANGDITEEQATRARERVESGEGPGFPFRGRGGHHGHMGQMRGHLMKAEVAEFIGITPEELRDAVVGGQSVAQVAEANGVSAADLAAYLLDELTTRVNEAVADGKIDQARADEILANAPAKIDEKINRVGPLEGRGGPPEGAGHHDGFRGGGPGGFPHGGEMMETVAPTF